MNAPAPPSADLDLLALVRGLTGARQARAGERVASLWSGYGEIRRFGLEGAEAGSVVVKHVKPPRSPRHRRGWATDFGHQRKLRSYAVEQCFYRNYAIRCDASMRVPGALHLAEHDGGFLFVLEDLDAAGYPVRRAQLEEAELRACLSWLACFHARFLDAAPSELWEEGSYWHLSTRPEELAAMEPGALHDAATALDAKLRGARHRTLIHGDAKVANFCFGDDAAVAAVDFQYVGGGVGVKDVAYFFSSVLDSAQCEAQAPALLDHYFGELERALHTWQPAADADAVQGEWRALYPHAWADFTRFLLGWAPQHAKLHSYGRRQTEQALADLRGR